MKDVLSTNGEIPLLINNMRVVALSNLEQWQIDALTVPMVELSSTAFINHCLQAVDQICWDWINDLTQEQFIKIKKQGSLHGIPLPKKWIIVWRVIIKESGLRNSFAGARGGSRIGSFTHLWNLWAEDNINKYLNETEKELLELVDKGYLYDEVGNYLLEKYGDKFWKQRKQKTITTPAQVVNYYLYQKMPTKICRNELTDLILNRIRRINNEKNKKK